MRGRGGREEGGYEGRIEGGMNGWMEGDRVKGRVRDTERVWWREPPLLPLAYSVVFRRRTASIQGQTKVSTEAS
jgi:hypothetical protein